MKPITDYIDIHLNTTLADATIRYFGLAELVTKDTERFPATVNGREKVSFDSSYNAFCYHRVIDNSPEYSEELSFGLSRKTQDNITIRTVLAYKIDSYDEMFRYTFENSFPRIIRLSGYDPIFLEQADANEDHEAIVEEEFLQLPYEKHRITWNVYSFDNTIELVICSE